ncbi:PLP-dependent transferase [Venturia nashicola]|uniref:Molybdenum cofactor sulfurase n=1 Tax=Venturia nashicola TaxID=86259 RepID=A0A4Z1PCV1_9PEZI|nr:PLP-dependent transferase [Venturia nashicola]TLD39124.1 PLP-dependent transferase [Venturia nashicola]
MERFSADMISNLYGNPHSASNASQNTSKRIEDARLRLLDLFQADPDEFDVVFVANATAGIKLVMDAFRDSEEGYWFGYHRDSHTSLVGVREHAKEHRCLGSDQEVERWIRSATLDDSIHRQRLFAYPAQSNMNGRRLPLDWCRQLRQLKYTYSLLDAAALVSTSPLDLSDPLVAPDFTVLSLYKPFGFPDLGALIVRRSSAHVFQSRKYFGGGTVDMVVCIKEQWHAKKMGSVHERLEDGTLPVHNILALHSALDVHRDLYGSLNRVSKHCAFLAKRLHDSLSALRHANGREVCQIYKDTSSDYSDTKLQGPIVAFNVRNVSGGWVTNSEIERLASIRNIHLRTGGLCNPGGMASSLQLNPWEMKRNFSAGHRCGNEDDVMHGKPTGMIRLSLGAMSTIKDVEIFVDFLQEFFVASTIPMLDVVTVPSPTDERWYVESLSIYPIKSCAGWRVPPQTAWMVNKEGLAWDREWCLVRPGSGIALSQKRYPRMALIRPAIDWERGILRVSFSDQTAGISPISIPLSLDTSLFSTDDFALKDAKVCEDVVAARVYQSSTVAGFFTQALGVACQLARFPANGSLGSTRHAKAHLQSFQDRKTRTLPGTFPEEVQVAAVYPPRPILLSNESPILTISRSSLNRLNEQIKSTGGKAVHAEVFRANIVVAEHHRSIAGFQEPYAEDDWHMMQIGSQHFQFLGSCRRCQMVCIDQETAVKNQEPFSTLAKTRRIDGKVYFGQHTCHVHVAEEGRPQAQKPTIMVGDAVNPYSNG